MSIFSSIAHKILIARSSKMRSDQDFHTFPAKKWSLKYFTLKKHKVKHTACAMIRIYSSIKRISKSRETKTVKRGREGRKCEKVERRMKYTKKKIPRWLSQLFLLFPRHISRDFIYVWMLRNNCRNRKKSLLQKKYNKFLPKK